MRGIGSPIWEQEARYKQIIACRPPSFRIYACFRHLRAVVSRFHEPTSWATCSGSRVREIDCCVAFLLS
jgi:hypothetical protein